MISFVLISENKREEQILKMAFEQQGVKILLAKPTYSNYVLILQCLPDLMMIEMPRVCTEHLDFTKRVRQYKRTRNLPILAYGDTVTDMVKRGMTKQGVTLYTNRPLKFTALLQTIERLLKPLNKKIEIKKAEISDKERDLNLILNSDAPASQKIEAMIRHVAGLLAFPFTVAKVLQITQDEKSGAGHLAHAIAADPAMSTHLLKVANSVFFASSNRRINSIQDSIVRIGFMETKKIVMSMTVMKLFDTQNKNLGFDRIDFWYHSLSAGLIAERVAKAMGDVNIEEAFLAGLIHDLGIMILDEHFPTIFSKVLEENSRKCGNFAETQLEMLKVNHNDMIGGLFPNWKIPQNITDAILLHETIMFSDGNFDTQGKKISICVEIANILSKSLHIGRECDEFIRPLPNWLFKEAKMPHGIHGEFVDQLTHNVEVFRNFLGLEKREYVSQTGIDKSESINIGIANTEMSVFVPPYLYLKKDGFKIENVNTYGSLSEYDKKFHLIVAWVGKNTAVDNLKALGKIVKFDDAPEEELSMDIKFVPVLVIGPEDYPASELPSRFTFMKNTFDLRFFDLTISELLSKK
jgi:HD-like signal output (HDOD) protein